MKTAALNAIREAYLAEVDRITTICENEDNFAAQLYAEKRISWGQFNTLSEEAEEKFQNAREELRASYRKIREAVEAVK